MKVRELFEKLEEKFVDVLCGEIQLQGNCIIWTYNLDNNSEDIEVQDEDEDDETFFNFQATSPAELLQDACDDDKERINDFLDELDECDNWTFSEPETIGNIISFKIF